MSVDPKTNEWNLLKHQFDALVHDESVGAESIDEIFDVQFRRRFTELINQTAQRTSTNVYNWPRKAASGLRTPRALRARSFISAGSRSPGATLTIDFATAR